MNNTLSEKDIRLLKLAAICGTYKQIAKEMNCTDEAIKYGARVVCSKLNVDIMRQAVYKATKEGLI